MFARSVRESVSELGSPELFPATRWSLPVRELDALALWVGRGERHCVDQTSQTTSLSFRQSLNFHEKFLQRAKRGTSALPTVIRERGV